MLRTFRSLIRVLPKRNLRFVIPLASMSYRKLNAYSFSNKKEDEEKLKNQSKQFYEQQVTSIVDIQTAEDWRNHVELAHTPIVLDCYADWCQPCKKLTPILEERAKSAKDWKLVKLNIDKLPKIAQMLKIKSVPTVYLLYEGRALDGFNGMPDEKKLTGFFGSLQKILTIGKIGEEQAKKFDEGRMLLGAGKFAQAEKHFSQMIKGGNLIGDLLPMCLLLLSQCYIKVGKITNYEETINKVKTEYKKQIQAKTPDTDLFRDFIADLDKQYEQIKSTPLKDDKLVGLKKAVEASPKDLELKYQLAEAYSEKELQEEALKLLLDIIKTDKNWQDKKASKLLLEIFKKLGATSQITNKYRKLYQRLLY